MATFWAFTDNSTKLTVDRTIDGHLESFDINKQLILLSFTEPYLYFRYSMPENLDIKEFLIDFNLVTSPVSVSASDLATQLQAMLDSFGGGATTFIGLTDVPASYAGAAGQVVRVNAGETGLEFFTVTGTGTVTSVASADSSITITNPTTTVDLAVVKSPKLTTARNIGGVAFDGTADIVPQTIESANEATDNSCFPLFITASGTQQLQPKNNAGFIYDSSANKLTATTFNGTLTGNASTATALQTARAIGGVNFDGTAAIVPQTIQTTDESTDTTCFPLFITASGAQSLQPHTNTGLIYNSNTNNLTATTFTGALAGNATTATTASAVAVGGITGLGTGVATALAVNVGSAGAFITFNGNAGTPSAIVLTNATGIASGLTAGIASTVASANEATDTSCFPLFITASGTQTLATKNNAGFIYNSNTNALTATTFIGALTGTASGNANTALSNLAAVAINTDLLPTSNNTIGIGSDTLGMTFLKFADSGFIGWGTGGGNGAILTTGTAMTFINSASYAFDAVIKPSASTVDLGVTSTAPFRNLFLAATGKIDFGNADVTVTAGTNTLTFAGASSGYTFDAALTIGTGNALTCGTIELGNASDTTLSRASAAVLNLEGVALLRSTCGVAASPTASQTDTITHGLSRTPTMIRIYGIGGFTNNTSAVPCSQSMGIFNATGNRCVYQRYNAAAVTTAQASETSTSFAVFLGTSAANFVSGVIGNVGATTFDIVWTETGTSIAQSYMWEAQ